MVEWIARKIGSQTASQEMKGFIVKPEEEFIIVWCDSKLYFICDDRDDAKDQLKLVLDECGPNLSIEVLTPNKKLLDSLLKEIKDDS